MAAPANWSPFTFHYTTYSSISSSSSSHSFLLSYNLNRTRVSLSRKLGGRLNLVHLHPTSRHAWPPMLCKYCSLPVCVCVIVCGGQIGQKQTCHCQRRLTMSQRLTIMSLCFFCVGWEDLSKRWRSLYQGGRRRQLYSGRRSAFIWHENHQTRYVCVCVPRSPHKVRPDLNLFNLCKLKQLAK